MPPSIIPHPNNKCGVFRPSTLHRPLTPPRRYGSSYQRASSSIRVRHDVQSSLAQTNTNALRLHAGLCTSPILRFPALSGAHFLTVQRQWRRYASDPVRNRQSAFQGTNHRPNDTAWTRTFKPPDEDWKTSQRQRSTPIQTGSPPCRSPPPLLDAQSILG